MSWKRSQPSIDIMFAHEPRAAAGEGPAPVTGGLSAE